MDLKKKLFNLQNSRKVLLDAASAAVEAGDMELYNSKMAEANTIKTQIEGVNALIAELEEGETEPLAPEFGDDGDDGANNGSAKTANALRAVMKACMGRKLTPAENSLLVRTPGSDDGNGEGFILPQDINTIIQKKIRQYKSLREVLGYMPTTALSGSFPVENFETLSELVDFTDGTDGTEATDIKFKNVSFALKEKGALLSLSNTLLAMTDNSLIEYVSECFAKKAVITENKMAITVLKTGKTIKSLADYKALKSSINRDLDEGVKYGCVIVTNQDSYDKLDSEVDGTGRPILQPVVNDPTQKTFMGYPIIVFSNAMLPTTGTDVKKAPIFYGNLAEAVTFIDNNAYSFALSEHAGFKANMTIARVIEYVDVVQKDSSDKIYIYGEFTVSGDEDDIVNIIPVAALPEADQDATAIYVLTAADGDKDEGTMWTWSGTAWVEHTNA